MLASVCALFGELLVSAFRGTRMDFRNKKTGQGTYAPLRSMV
jgi:hypothetical protein